MTTDENIMQEMLDRATNPTRNTVDELAVQMFCMIVRSNSTLIHKAQELIMSKVRSNNISEATRAIALLEECMTQSGSEFQDEIGKFRFLNELIRLVSKKYQGAETPAAIKQRIMECLLLWTTEYPQKLKIREAYDMLNKEGGIEYVNSPAVAAKRESTLGIDEQKLSKLINSKDPEDYKRANLLIQHQVIQESRRRELLLQHKSELQEVESTVGLLNQMLDTFESEGYGNNSDSETMNLIRELYISCKKHKPILQRLHEMIGNIDEELIAETLETNDLLLAVLKRYKDIVVHPPSKLPQTSCTTTTSTAELLSDLLGEVGLEPMGGAEMPSTMNINDLLDTTTVVPSLKTSPLKANASVPNTLEELSDIFSGVTKPSPSQIAPETVKYPSQLLENLNLLEPVNIYPKPTETKVKNVESNANEKRAFRELRAIDELSEELLKQNLQTNERLGSFKIEADKPTLNELAKEKINASKLSPPISILTKSSKNIENSEIVNSPKIGTLKIDEDEKILTTAGDNQNDDAMLSSGNQDSLSKESTLDDSDKLSSDKFSKINDMPYKPLSEITINLDDVTATSEEHSLLDDEDMKITLNFTTDRPSTNVSVIVISVQNKSKMPVRDFNFEASVKKPCKVRLLPPSDNALKPHKPFRPPTPINQVMLLSNPTGKAVNVTCIVGYKLGDDPDPIKESIVAKDIPFVE